MWILELKGLRHFTSWIIVQKVNTAVKGSYPRSQLDNY